MGTWIPSKIFSNGPFTLTRVDKGVIVCKENDRNNSSHNGLSFILYKNCTAVHVQVKNLYDLDYFSSTSTFNLTKV